VDNSIADHNKWTVISNTGRYTSCREFFRALKILPLPCLYISEIVCYIKINIDRLEPNTEIHDYNTRQNMDLHVQSCRTNLFKKSVLNMGITLYNKLPSHMKKIEKMKHFKKEVRSFFIATYFLLRRWIHVSLISRIPMYSKLILGKWQQDQ
jgi:hypothetical protein